LQDVDQLFISVDLSSLSKTKRCSHSTIAYSTLHASHTPPQLYSKPSSLISSHLVPVIQLLSEEYCFWLMDKLQIQSMWFR